MSKFQVMFEDFMRDHYEENKDGQTPLMLIMKEGFVTKDFVAKLLENEKDINHRDKNGRTALMYAIHYANSVDTIKCLVEHGADVNAIDNDRRSALHYEADSPCFSEGRLIVLLENGANPLAVDKKGAMPLTLAKKHVLAFYKDALGRLEKATDAAQTKRAKTMAKQMDWYIDRSDK